MQEIIQSLTTTNGGLDSSTITEIFSALGSGAMSGLSSLVPVILEIILLAMMCCPMYGLRLIPFYGKYYFWKMLIPEKKVLGAIHVILSFIVSIIACIWFVYLFIALFAGLFGADEMLSSGELLITTLVVCTLGIVCFILNIMLNLALAERFGYNPALGILFVFIPIIGTICCMVKAREVVNVPNYLEAYKNPMAYAARENINIPNM